MFPESAARFSDKEQFPEIYEESHLKFIDANGAIRAGCYFGDVDFVTFDLGIIPERIASQGKEAIKKHANKKMRQLIKVEETRLSEKYQRMDNLHVELHVEHRQTIIKGYVEKSPEENSDQNTMTLTMTEPFQLKILLNVQPSCFAASVGGLKTFDDDGMLLDQEIKRQEEALLDIYEGEIRKRRRRPAHPALAQLHSDPSVKVDSEE